MSVIEGAQNSYYHTLPGAMYMSGSQPRGEEQCRQDGYAVFISNPTSYSRTAQYPFGDITMWGLKDLPRKGSYKLHGINSVMGQNSQGFQTLSIGGKANFWNNGPTTFAQGDEVWVATIVPNMHNPSDLMGKIHKEDVKTIERKYKTAIYFNENPADNDDYKYIYPNGAPTVIDNSQVFYIGKCTLAGRPGDKCTVLISKPTPLPLFADTDENIALA